MIYRKEIDGLRAVAVLPVIFFHAGLGPFSGGFLGVDVFFVISGYLITSIIIEDKKNNRFSFLRFYERRARRILPALITVMLICIPFALWLMLPDDLENFGQSLVATTLFSNNILLWLTTSYFQLESEFKPLLHTWTLGVEEQYYVLYPALIGLLWFLRNKGLVIALTFLALGSLLLPKWGWADSPAASFYLLPSRGWELLAGGLTALYLLQNKQNTAYNQWLSLIGLGMILYSVVMFDATTPTPSTFTTIPVLGTVLIIVFALPGTITNRILSTQGLVSIGLISYSLYLWHQPLLAFMRITRLQEPSPINILVCLVATVVLSILSFHYIEKPFRNASKISTRSFVITCSAASIFLAAFGLYLHFSSGIVRNWSELEDGTVKNQLSAGLNKQYNKSAQRFYAESFPDNDKKNILVLGDSFARDFINIGVENSYFDEKNLVYAYGDVCQFYEESFLDETNKQLIRSANTVVFAVRFSLDDTDCIQSMAAHFKTQPTTKVLVIGLKNFGWNNNALMLIDPVERYITHVDMLKAVVETNNAMKTTLARYPAIHFVDIMSIIADEDGKVPVFTPDRKFISQDRQHLTKAGARYIGAELRKNPAIKLVF